MLVRPARIYVINICYLIYPSRLLRLSIESDSMHSVCSKWARSDDVAGAFKTFRHLVVQRPSAASQGRARELATISPELSHFGAYVRQNIRSLSTRRRASASAALMCHVQACTPSPTHPWRPSQTIRRSLSKGSSPNLYLFTLHGACMVSVW